MLKPSLFLAIILSLPLALSGCGQEPAPESLGLDAKKLEVKSLDGDKFKITWRAQKPFVVNVWATWCAPCVKELPSLMALEEKGEFALLTIAIDSNPAVVKTFLQQQGFTALPTVWDKNGQKVREKLGLRGVPTTYILDENQRVVGVEQGERDWDHPDMIAKIRGYLKHSGSKE